MLQDSPDPLASRPWPREYILLHAMTVVSNRAGFPRSCLDIGAGNEFAEVKSGFLDLN